MKVLMKKLAYDAKIPKQSHPTDAGFDVFASVGETVLIPPGSQALISSGFKIGICPSLEEYEDGCGSDYVWVMDVRSRSGLAAKNGVFVANSPGTVDQSYTGELKVILYNGGSEGFFVKNGDRIAQLVFTRAYLPILEETDYIPSTDRGESGFGSTGV